MSQVADSMQSGIETLDLSSVEDDLQGIIDKASDAINEIAEIPNNVTTTVTREVEYQENPSGRDTGAEGPGDSDDDDDHDTDVSPPTNYDPGGDDDDGPARGSEDDGSTGFVGLARGGYVTGATAAFVGEGTDDEFVTPHSTMERILRDVAREAMSAGGGGGDTYHFDIDVDGSDMSERELIQAVKDEFKQDLKRQLGRP
ncbi:hypothetical protein C2R22_05895 [Salinigranum rubrum]|uniref:Uncharacterized protein n=1 Tax=Salinigranum rubrum TaxID=755307 RepID=A0A2I8VH59_9EURY|nr:hypothetical protein [Salinigranum rubrum]AUV81250.1 hypothetical protein C2R22_05895 [Salinigranum rubrum]